MAENKSIFEFADKFGYESPFGDWLAEEKAEREERARIRENLRGAKDKPLQNQNSGSGIKPEGETQLEKDEVLKYLVSSQHPDVRGYFVFEDKGFIDKTKVEEGKKEIIKNTKFTAEDRLVFEDLYTLVTASIPYKIAIHQRAAWMFPIQTELPPEVYGGGKAGMYKNLTDSVMSVPRVSAKQYKLDAPDMPAGLKEIVKEMPYKLYATKGDFEMIGGISGQTYLHEGEEKGKLVAIFTLVSPGLNELGKAQTIIHEMIHAYYHYLKYIEGKKVEGGHKYNEEYETVEGEPQRIPNSVLHKQEDENKELTEKQELHMRRVKELNSFSK